VISVKRIELVIPEHLLRDAIEVIDTHRPGGYTVLRGLSGMGDRGPQRDAGIVSDSANAAILVACDAETAGRIAEALRPLLRRFGGMCLVSDALWLKH
jgi:PII-like signaling protein